MRKILESCPSCGGPLTITEVRCESCATEVRSRYQPCPFCRLSPEQTSFVLLFVQNRGNLSDLEKVLGVSYPTIRGKLEEIIRIITAPTPKVGSATPGKSSVSPTSAGRRHEILTKIANGKLSVADGLTALRQAGDEVTT